MHGILENEIVNMIIGIENFMLNFYHISYFDLEVNRGRKSSFGLRL